MTQHLAAIRAQKDQPVDHILLAVHRQLTAEGRRILGFLQEEREGEAGLCGRMVLRDMTTGESFVISQDLGVGARGCRLDPQALAALVGPLRSRIEAGADLLILNRFGKGETEGHGFRAVIEAACARSVPVLVAVREAYVDAWLSFTGDLGTLLPPDPAAALCWARSAVGLSPNAVQGDGDSRIRTG